ncbi:MAG: hypothetical protein M1582_04100, partial [Actinobacteria bacterium]|nr:hypothetical protein [Actinomycetota bacterium]
HEPDIAAHTRRIIHIRDGQIHSDEIVPEDKRNPAALEILARLRKETDGRASEGQSEDRADEKAELAGVGGET